MAQCKDCRYYERLKCSGGIRKLVRQTVPATISLRIAEEANRN